MSESFAPLVLPSSPSEESSFAPLSLRLFRGASAAILPEPPKSLAAAANASPKCAPEVTLQRNGEVVTAIHIECSCGQVIDLNCVYPESKGK